VDQEGSEVGEVDGEGESSSLSFKARGDRLGWGKGSRGEKEDAF